MKILIIDDNPALVNVFAKLLRIKGFFVATESTLKDGLQRLENEFYHVVFVDAPLNDSNEDQILTLFHKSNIFKKTNVFLLSSNDFDTLELDKWKKYGLYSYLKKPVKRGVLLKSLYEVPVTDFPNSEVMSEPEPISQDDEEATPEQLSRLEQLEKQLQEMETQPEPEPEPISQDDEEATPEQLSRLEQLEKQLQEMETQPEPTLKKSNVLTGDDLEEIIKKELEQTLSEISILKNEIQFYDKIDDDVGLQHNSTLSSFDKKRKTTKKPTDKTKKRKTTKKSK